MNIKFKRNLGNKTLAIAVLTYALLQTGCAPTYPREMVDKAIIQLCRQEYNLDVKVKIEKNTVGVYMPIEGLFDMTLNISKEAVEKINDVMLSVSRVTLSTDAPLDFYIVIVQDPLLPEIEVVLIRYVLDIKLLHYSQISRGEFAKRMIIDIKLTPQAQKEKTLRDVFGKLNIKEADDLIAEYLRTSEVTTIGDIGYWNDDFYIKSIGMGEFLGLQIAERVKAKFATTLELREKFKLNLIKGEFLEEGGKNLYRFNFDVTSSNEAALFLSEDDLDKIFSVVVSVASNVLHGYKFKDFWNIEIVNSKDNQVLFATLDELEEFRKKKIKIEEFRRWYK